MKFAGHEAQFLGQIFLDDLRQETVGQVRIHSEQTIHLEVLRFVNQGGKIQLTSTPPSFYTEQSPAEP